MRFGKRGISLLLCLLVLAALVPARASAAGLIDKEREVSMTVNFRLDGVPLVKAPFALYLVATVDEYGELMVTDDFSAFPIDIRGENEEAWRTLASTLDGYVAQAGLTPADSGVTDDFGLLHFPHQAQTLPQGLYFVPGFRYVQGEFIYEAQPFLVLLPAVDGQTNQWVYDLEVQPKSVQPEDRPMIRRVLKIWNDNGAADTRPKSVVVQLLCNGEVYDTVTLSAENNWRWEWQGLSANLHWTVVEKTPEGYKVEITQEGVTFVVTNTPQTAQGPGGPDEPQLPQTGQLWWPVPVLLVLGLALIAAGLLRRRSGEDA